MKTESRVSDPWVNLNDLEQRFVHAVSHISKEALKRASRHEKCKDKDKENSGSEFSNGEEGTSDDSLQWPWFKVYEVICLTKQLANSQDFDLFKVLCRVLDTQRYRPEETPDELGEQKYSKTTPLRQRHRRRSCPYDSETDNDIIQNSSKRSKGQTSHSEKIRWEEKKDRTPDFGLEVNLDDSQIKCDAVSVDEDEISNINNENNQINNNNNKIIDNNQINEKNEKNDEVIDLKKTEDEILEQNESTSSNNPKSNFQEFNFVKEFQKLLTCIRILFWVSKQSKIKMSSPYLLPDFVDLNIKIFDSQQILMSVKFLLAVFDLSPYSSTADVETFLDKFKQSSVQFISSSSSSSRPPGGEHLESLGLRQNTVWIHLTDGSFADWDRTINKSLTYFLTDESGQSDFQNALKKCKSLWDIYLQQTMSSICSVQSFLVATEGSDILFQLIRSKSEDEWTSGKDRAMAKLNLKNLDSRIKSLIGGRASMNDVEIRSAIPEYLYWISKGNNLNAQYLKEGDWRLSVAPPFRHVLDIPLQTPLENDTMMISTERIVEVIKYVVDEWERQMIEQEKQKAIHESEVREELREKQAQADKRLAQCKAVIDYILRGDEKRKRSPQHTNPLLILGIPTSLANESMIKKVKRQVMLYTHPDKLPSQEKEFVEKSTKAFLLATEALNVLSESVKSRAAFFYSPPTEPPPYAAECDLHINCFIDNNNNKSKKNNNLNSKPSSGKNDAQRPDDSRTYHCTLQDSNMVETAKKRNKANTPMDPGAVFRVLFCVFDGINITAEMSYVPKFSSWDTLGVYVSWPFVGSLNDPNFVSALDKVPKSLFIDTFLASYSEFSNHSDLKNTFQVRENIVDLFPFIYNRSAVTTVRMIGLQPKVRTLVQEIQWFKWELPPGTANQLTQLGKAKLSSYGSFFARGCQDIYQIDKREIDELHRPKSISEWSDYIYQLGDLVVQNGKPFQKFTT